MGEKIKASLLLLIVLIIISLSLAGTVFFLLQKERAKSLSLQEQLGEATVKLKMTEAKLDDSKKVAAGLDAKLKEATLQISKLNDEVEQEKSARQEALKETERLRADSEQDKRSRADLENKLMQAQKDANKIQIQLKDLSSKKEELEKKIKNLEARSTQGQGIELGKVVVMPEVANPSAIVSGLKKSAVKAAGRNPAGKSPVLATEGKVLVVNSDYNFVVINLGNKDGVALDQVFSLYRGNKYIGDVKVEKVHDSMAAAGFLTPDIKDKVAEGDKVVRKSK